MEADLATFQIITILQSKGRFLAVLVAMFGCTVNQKFERENPTTLKHYLKKVPSQIVL